MLIQPDSLQGNLVRATASTDTVAPSSAVTAPIAGARIPYGETYVINGTASDPQGNRWSVEVSTDNGVTWHPVNGTSSGISSWSYNWSPTPGKATIKSRAVDDSGNLELPGAGVTVDVTGIAGDRIWPDSARPAIESESNARSVELG